MNEIIEIQLRWRFWWFGKFHICGKIIFFWVHLTKSICRKVYNYFLRKTPRVGVVLTIGCLNFQKQGWSNFKARSEAAYCAAVQTFCSPNIYYDKSYTHIAELLSFFRESLCPFLSCEAFPVSILYSDNTRVGFTQLSVTLHTWALVCKRLQSSWPTASSESHRVPVNCFKD